MCDKQTYELVLKGYKKRERSQQYRISAQHKVNKKLTALLHICAEQMDNGYLKTLIETELETYSKYVANIEYEVCSQGISKDLFNKGRIEFPNNILKEWNPIFHTDYFYNKYENKARNNLKVELNNRIKNGSNR